MRGRINAKLVILLLQTPLHVEQHVRGLWHVGNVTCWPVLHLHSAGDRVCKFMEDVDIANAVRSIICCFLVFFYLCGGGHSDSLFSWGLYL